MAERSDSGENDRSGADEDEAEGRFDRYIDRALDLLDLLSFT